VSVDRKALIRRILKKRPVMVLITLSVGRSAQRARTDIPAPGKHEEGSPDRPLLSV
jgi:hypothetical protein